MEEAVIPSTLQWFSRQPPAIVRQRRGTCYRTWLPCTSGAFASARHGKLGEGGRCFLHCVTQSHESLHMRVRHDKAKPPIHPCSFCFSQHTPCVSCILVLPPFTSPWQLHKDSDDGHPGRVRSNTKIACVVVLVTGT